MPSDCPYLDLRCATLAISCTNEVFLCKDKWIFKPQPPLDSPPKDECSLRDGISPRREYLREIAAYHLDRVNGSFAGVPTTVGVSLQASDTALLRALCTGEISTNAGITPTETLCGSVQEWIEHRCCSEDMGPSRFSTSDVHRIGLLDLRFVDFQLFRFLAPLTSIAKHHEFLQK